MEKKMILPENVLKIISRLEASGHTAYVVGGSVRDALLGRDVNDFDLTSSATPDEIKTCFSDERTIDTGIQHGTVTLLLDGSPYEITTYRVDGEYLDNRHPAEVRFTDNINLDLARRDFTVNAIAYNPSSGFVDPYLGRADADKKIIRAVGDPRVRFDEDALRILRALRFSSVLGFEIHHDTASAIREKHRLLENVSRERIFVELRKLLGGILARSVISEFSEVILGVLPPLEKVVLPPDAASTDWLTLLLGIFALSSTNPSEDFDIALRALRADNHTRILGVEALLAYQEGRRASEQSELLTLLRDFGEEVTREILTLYRLLGRDCALESELNGLIASGAPYRVRDLAIRGEDVLALGVKGASVGRLLSLALDRVVEGRVENERAQLLSLVKELIEAE